MDGVYLVVGGSSGIGAATVKALSEQGARVMNADIQPPDPRSEIPYIPVDVSSAASIRQAVAQIGTPLNGWFHAAGIDIPIAVDEMTDEQIERQIQVNLVGPCLMAKYLSPLLADGASVVLVASELAFIGSRQSTVYTATKGGITALVRSLAVLWRQRHIRVNALCPGPTETDMIRRVWNLSDNPLDARHADERAVVLGRIGQPEEIAKAAVFLLSNDASYIDGHALVVDGGSIIW